MTGREVSAKPYLSDDQVALYHKNGYLVLPNVLTAEELAAVRAAADALDEERLQRGGAERTVAIHDVIFLQEAFMAAAHHPALIGASVQIIGENLHLIQARVHWKPIAKGEGAVAWHQDYPFHPLTNYDVLAVTFLLDDTTVQNGALQAIPGSHKRGPVSHHDANGAFVSRCTNADDYAADVARGNLFDLEGPAGSMTIHHANLLHYTHPNNSDTPRRALVYQIAAGDAALLGGNFFKVWPVYLHGSDPQIARFEDGTIRRLPQPFRNLGGLDS